MADKAFIKNESEYLWEYGKGEEGRNGVIRWRTLLSGEETPTEKISMGTLELPINSILHPHHHAPLEVYYITKGEGTVLVGEEKRNVKAGDVVYIPGNLTHGIKNMSDQLLTVVWVFPTSTWRKIEYHDDDDVEL